MLRWFEENGRESDVVISSRVRLARNIRDYNFSLKLTDDDARKMVNDLTAEIGKLEAVKDYSSYDFARLDDYQKMAMKERHVISDFLLGQKVAAGFVSKEEDVSIMLNEEDHIRIQAYASGMNMEKAFELADKTDDAIEQAVSYAYDEKYGYLTTCPSNVGTGMRASYMLHLPALSSNNRISGLAAEVGRFGLVMRGVYGDSSRSYGDIYQLSNQITLGISEKEIIDNLSHIANQIISQERALRRQYVINRKLSALDAVYRSYGVLRYARKMSLKDAMLLLSQVRLGLAQGLVMTDSETEFCVYQLMIGIQTANLALMNENELSEEELEEYRAKFIRDNLPVIR